MTLLEILTDICSRVGDVYLERYKTRAKDHFARAVSNFMNGKEITQEEIPGYYLLKDDLEFSSLSANIQSLQAFKVKSLHLPPTITDINISITILEEEEVRNMAGIEANQPTVNDLFVYRVGNVLYAVVAEGTQVELDDQAFHLWYIKDFSLSGLDDEYDFSSTDNYLLSESFIRKCIEAATVSLLNEVNT